MNISKCTMSTITYNDYTCGMDLLPTGRTSGVAENDTNTYTLGQMGKHNVVLACLPSVPQLQRQETYFEAFLEFGSA